MNEKDIQKKIENEFQCQRCNECCRKPGYVYLLEEEVQPIADFLKQDVRVFMDEYCEIVDRRRIVLKKKKGETCIFLEDSGCQINPVKPSQCRDFPVRWNTPASFEYCVGLKKILK